MGMNWAEHSEDIDAPVETCFDAIVDYESFPRWQDAVDSVEVLSRTADGLGQDVRLFVDAKIRKIDYVLRYGYTRPTEILWDFVEGNGMRDCDGVYTLEELGPERTRATYKLGADPELPVPGMILRRTHKQLVKRSVEDLKRESERRHAAGEEPSAPPAPAAAAEEEAPAPAEPPAAGGEQEPAPSADVPPRTEWRPKAERVAAAEAPREAGGPAPRSRSRAGVSDSIHGAAEDALGKAASTGREVADGAMRAGIGAAESAVEIGRDVAGGLIRRVNRILGNDRAG